MRVEQFDVEVWMNEHETEAVWNLGETCIDSLTLDELLELGGHAEATLRELRGRKLTYGDITGAPRLRRLIAALYDTVDADDVLVTQGAIGANFLAEYTLVEPGDRVVCVQPTYQQLYSVPASFGADVRLLRLRPEDGFLPDLDELRALAGEAREAHLHQQPQQPDRRAHRPRRPGAHRGGGPRLRRVPAGRRGLPRSGARPGRGHAVRRRPLRARRQHRQHVQGLLARRACAWAGSPGPARLIAACERHRDYTTISCGMLDEALAVIALEHRERLLERNLGIVQGNVATLREWLAAEPRLDWVPPAAGTTAFLRYDYDIPSERFAQELFDLNGTFLVPGSCFAMDGWLRLGYACSAAVLRGGLDGISAYLRQLEARGL